jgi:hypothetical protein
MDYDYRYFFRRYQQLEDDFFELTDFIGLKRNFDEHCYMVGSSIDGFLS